MKTGVFILTILATCFFVSCSVKNDGPADTKSETVDSSTTISKKFIVDCGQLKRDAIKMDSILLGQIEVDEPSAKKAIVAFTEFANYCDTDTLSPVFLIKTAQVARVINHIPQAKTALDQCIAAYPHFRDRPAALFLLAQLYDENTYLNNEQEAKALYQKIIDEHPKSPWANSAKGAIAFIGKSDKQIMEELKKKH